MRLGEPKFEVYKTSKDGEVAVELVVRNSMRDKNLHELVISLNFEPTPNVPNRRRIFCTTADQINSVRDPLRKFFDSTGTYRTEKTQ